MPFTVSEILATQDRTIHIVADEGGGFRLAADDEEPLVTATYRVGAMTARSAEEIRVRMDGAPPNDSSWLRALLVELIASWDIETDDHEPFPITEEALVDLPYGLLGGVYDCINKDAEIPKANTSRSSDGSARPKTARKGSGPKARSRTGTTRSSASRVPRAS